MGQLTRPRRSVRGRHLFGFARWALYGGTAVLSLAPRSAVTALLALARHLPGYPGLAVRYMCVRRLAGACGDNVAIYTGVHLHNLAKMRFGSNVKIGEMCFIGAAGGVTIGNDVSVAHGSSILTEAHDYRQAGPLRDTDVLLHPITIGDGSWVGAGVRVLSGVRIGRGVAIGAGSVVTHDVPDDAVAAGVPARVLRSREAATA